MFVSGVHQPKSHVSNARASIMSFHLLFYLFFLFFLSSGALHLSVLGKSCLYSRGNEFGFLLSSSFLDESKKGRMSWMGWDGLDGKGGLRKLVGGNNLAAQAAFSFFF